MIRFIKRLFKVENAVPKHVDIRYRKLPNLDFADLENSFHKRTFGFNSYEEKLSRDNPRLLNWIGSVDYSGHVREQCLRYLIDNYKPGDENRILLRLEDWVPQVREIAQQWTRANFCKLSIEQIEANHRLILYLSRKQRLSHSENIETINLCLLQKIEQLDRRQFFALNANLRRYIYMLGLPDNSRLRHWVVYDKDPINRLLLIQLFEFDELTKEEFDRLNNDKSTLVKRRFIVFQVEHGVQPNQEQLTLFALDQNKGIREIARYYLSKYYGINGYEIYKERNDDSFYFIADYSKKEDIEHFLEGMRSDKKRVKHLCLRAICAIEPDYLRSLDLKQLIVESRRYRDLLSHHLPLLVSLDELKEYKDILEQATTNGTLIYLNMVLRKSFWHFLDSSLSVLIEDMSEENINFIRHRFYSRTSIYENLPSALKGSISNKVDALREVREYRVQELLRQIEFAAENA